jgi:hypothetical protein
VSELEDTWQMVLAEAERRAQTAGRGQVADYVALRVANDTARQAGVDWLFNTFSGLIGEANRVGAGVEVEKTAPHRFAVGPATMVGALQTFRYGVRQMMVAAGWPRSPGDGFVRGGGLACAQVRHFGLASANEELLLVREAPKAPFWLTLSEESLRQPFSEASARWHVGKFLGVN